jgi:DNA repair protein RadC
MLARNQLNYFPFYSADIDSWNRVKGRDLWASWNLLEQHICTSIGSSDIELLQLIGLDSKMHLTHSRIIARGTDDHLIAKIRYVAEQAFAMDAHGILLAHNHTNGVVTPSFDDVSYTRAINHAFYPLGIDLVDHCIVTEKNIFSMRGNCLVS